MAIYSDVPEGAAIIVLSPDVDISISALINFSYIILFCFNFFPLRGGILLLKKTPQKNCRYAAIFLDTTHHSVPSHTTVAESY
jgi:hypothetical protein